MLSPHDPPLVVVMVDTSGSMVLLMMRGYVLVVPPRQRLKILFRVSFQPLLSDRSSATPILQFVQHYEL
jgi:hypothetical protein